MDRAIGAPIVSERDFYYAIFSKLIFLKKRADAKYTRATRRVRAAASSADVRVAGDRDDDDCARSAE